MRTRQRIILTTTRISTYQTVIIQAVTPIDSEPQDHVSYRPYSDGNPSDWIANELEGRQGAGETWVYDDTGTQYAFFLIQAQETTDTTVTNPPGVTKVRRGGGFLVAPRVSGGNHQNPCLDSVVRGVKGYAIEVDKGQLRVVMPTMQSAQLFLCFRGEKGARYAVYFGYSGARSMPYDALNTWQDMGNLKITHHGAGGGKCPRCDNLSVSDAVRMILRVNGGVYAVYPENVRAAPSLIKPKLTTLWATLKGTP